MNLFFFFFDISIRSITFSSISSTYFSYCWIIQLPFPPCGHWLSVGPTSPALVVTFALRHVFGHRDDAPSAVPGFTATNIWPICNNDARMMIIWIFRIYFRIVWYLHDTCMILAWYLYDTCMILVWYLYDCIRKACHVFSRRLWTRS